LNTCETKKNKKIVKLDKKISGLDTKENEQLQKLHKLCEEILLSITRLVKTNSDFLMLKSRPKLKPKRSIGNIFGGKK